METRGTYRTSNDEIVLTYRKNRLGECIELDVYDWEGISGISEPSNRKPPEFPIFGFLGYLPVETFLNEEEHFEAELEALRRGTSGEIEDILVGMAACLLKIKHS